MASFDFRGVLVLLLLLNLFSRAGCKRQNPLKLSKVSQLQREEIHFSPFLFYPLSVNWFVLTHIEGRSSPLAPPTPTPISSGNTSWPHPDTMLSQYSRHSLMQSSWYLKLTHTLNLFIHNYDPCLWPDRWLERGRLGSDQLTTVSPPHSDAWPNDTKNSHFSSLAFSTFWIYLLENKCPLIFIIFNGSQVSIS
jgi:hypothetical protein